MAAEIFNIEIEQGSTFEWLALICDINGVPLDMGGYTGGTAGARGIIKKSYLYTTALALFTITIIDSAEVLAAVVAGQLHISSAVEAALEPLTVGKCYLLIRLDAAVTAALPVGSGVYDIEIEDTTGFVFKPYKGKVKVVPEVTRA